MSKRMIFSRTRRRSPMASALLAGVLLASITGGAFAAGLHVGVTYSVAHDTPRALISAAAFSTGD